MDTEFLIIGVVIFLIIGLTVLISLKKQSTAGNKQQFYAKKPLMEIEQIFSIAYPEHCQKTLFLHKYPYLASSR